jgi:hypothetical protein
MKPTTKAFMEALTFIDIQEAAKILDAETYKGFGQPEETELARLAVILDGKKAVTDLMCLKLFREFFDTIPRSFADYRWARLVLNLALKELRRYK